MVALPAPSMDAAYVSTIVVGDVMAAAIGSALPPSMVYFGIPDSPTGWLKTTVSVEPEGVAVTMPMGALGTGTLGPFFRRLRRCRATLLMARGIGILLKKKQ